MAEAIEKSHKPMHPPFTRMVCDAMHAMDETMGGQHPGHSLQSLKKYMGEHYKLGHGWEKRLNNTIKMMLKKRQLAHAAGHMGSYKLSKSMAAKEEKRLKRKPKTAKPADAPKEEAPKAEMEAEKPVKAVKTAKKKAAKMEGPAKRAKKAAPKKV